MRRTRASSVRSPAGSPATTSPSLRVVTYWQRSKISSSRCETKRMAQPWSRRARTTPKRRATSLPVRAAVGSSMIRTRASKESALAVSTSCWSAMDRPRAGRSGSRSTARRVKSVTGGRVHGAVVDAPQGAAGLAAHEDVLGHGQVGKERRLLVDDGHPGVAGVGRAVQDDRLAVELQDTGVGAVDPGERLDQGGLPGAVLAREGMDLDRRTARGRRSAVRARRRRTCSGPARPGRGALAWVTPIGRERFQAMCREAKPASTDRVNGRDLKTPKNALRP